MRKEWNDRVITSAKQAEKALLAKVPAKEMSDLELPPATIVIGQHNNSEKDNNKQKEECVGKKKKEPKVAFALRWVLRL